MPDKNGEQTGLFRKLAEVVAALEPLIKENTNQQQKYKFASVEQVKAAVRGPLAERHVVVFPSVREVIRSSAGTTSSGNPMTNTVVKGEITFVDGDDGGVFTIEAAGEGMDSADKSLSKAIAMMLKYAMIGVFQIVMDKEDTDDPDRETPARGRQAPGQRQAQRATQRPQEPPPGQSIERSEITPENVTVQQMSAAMFMALAREKGIFTAQITKRAHDMYGDTAPSLNALTNEQRHDLFQTLLVDVSGSDAVAEATYPDDIGAK